MDTLNHIEVTSGLLGKSPAALLKERAFLLKEPLIVTKAISQRFVGEEKKKGQNRAIRKHGGKKGRLKGNKSPLRALSASITLADNFFFSPPASKTNEADTRPVRVAFIPACREPVSE
ncbi:hypothetical protein EVAR_43010_1 [Eumeta japonica]|uniref:Uncharacterized protein n=1 Tax=Eumeta variegata TaxID=151549 RepID=A0A4C1XN60_EUMVA|nr:hypothetical protein EVAR_43010_1 [Eumeta japonica]